jgi:hypothetical protein
LNEGIPFETAFGRRYVGTRFAADDLVARPSDAMLARRHPWVVAGLWAWQTVLAVGVGWPSASLVCASYGACYVGDKLLFESGGRALLDLVWRGARSLASLTTTTGIVLAVGVVLGTSTSAAAMIAIAYTRVGRRKAGALRSLSGALRATPTLWLLGVAVTIAQGCLLGFGAGALAVADGWLEASIGLARTERLEIAIGVVFVLAVTGFGVVHDLARAAVVRLNMRAAQALVRGATTFGRNPLAVWWSWAWRSLTGLVPAIACAAVTTRIDERTGWALVLIAALHQSAVLSRAALRTSWFAHALRLVSRVRDS